jgi:hypothetical protein
LKVEEQAPREHEGEEAMCEILRMWEVKKTAQEWTEGRNIDVHQIARVVK